MRYATTLTLAVMLAITGIAFLMEWRDVFAVMAAITVIFIGLPVLSLASNFWFGESPPQLHVYDHPDEDYDRPSWLDQRDRRGMTKSGNN
jgi:cytochrome c biogenesis protein CcdA